MAEKNSGFDEAWTRASQTPVGRYYRELSSKPDVESEANFTGFNINSLLVIIYRSNTIYVYGLLMYDLCNTVCVSIVFVITWDSVWILRFVLSRVCSICFTVTAGLAKEHLLHQEIPYKVVRYMGLTRLFFPLSVWSPWNIFLTCFLRKFQF